MLSPAKIVELVLIFLIYWILRRSGVFEGLRRAFNVLMGGAPTPDDRPASGPTPAHIELAHKMLGLSPSASWNEVEKAYRKKAKIHHPDHGGDEDTMRALNDAYAQIKRYKGR